MAAQTASGVLDYSSGALKMYTACIPLARACHAGLHLLGRIVLHGWLHVWSSSLPMHTMSLRAAHVNAGVVFRIIGWGTGQPLLGAKTVAGMLMISTIVGELVSAHS